MASLTIRNIETEVKSGLRLRAARRGASMEEEARSILRAVVTSDIALDDLSAAGRPSRQSAWEGIRKLREEYGTFDLDIPERKAIAGDRPVFD
ncbi:MAG: plasmid stabilization protein [Nitratireductor sp.]